MNKLNDRLLARILIALLILSVTHIKTISSAYASVAVLDLSVERFHELTGDNAARLANGAPFGGVMSVLLGDNRTLIMPPPSSSGESVSYSSSNPSVARISSTGEVTLLDMGSSILFASQGAASSSVVLMVVYPTANPWTATLSNTSVVMGGAAPVLTTNTQSSGAMTYSSSNPSVATIDSRGVIALVGVGNVSFTVTQAVHGGYLAQTKTTPALTVSAAIANPWTATLSNTSVVMGGAAPVLTTNTQSSGAMTYSSSNPSVATIDSRGVIALVGVGNVSFTVTQAVHGGYLAQTKTTPTLTVSAVIANPWTATLSNTSVVMGGAAPVLTTNTQSSGAMTYSSSNPSVATIDSRGVIALVGVGNVSFTVTQAVHGGYLAQTKTTPALTVSAAIANPWTATLSNTSVVMGGAAPVLTTNTQSSGAMTYSSSNPSVATIDSRGVIALVGVGNVSFTVTQAVHGGYLAQTKTVNLVVRIRQYNSRNGRMWIPNPPYYASRSQAIRFCSRRGAWRAPNREELMAAFQANDVARDGWPDGYYITRDRGPWMNGQVKVHRSGLYTNQLESAGYLVCIIGTP